MLVGAIVEEVEDVGVGIREEFVSVEGVADGVILDPFALFLFARRVFVFVQVVSELVVSDDVRILFLGVLNAVRVVVVLGRGLDNQAQIG